MRRIIIPTLAVGLLCTMTYTGIGVREYLTRSHTYKAVPQEEKMCSMEATHLWQWCQDYLSLTGALVRTIDPTGKTREACKQLRSLEFYNHELDLFFSALNNDSRLRQSLIDTVFTSSPIIIFRDHTIKQRVENQIPNSTIATGYAIGPNPPEEALERYLQESFQHPVLLFRSNSLSWDVTKTVCGESTAYQSYLKN